MTTRPSPATTRPVLVTGGAGYLGARVVQELLQGGRTVRVLDVVPRTSAPFAGDIRVEHVQGDLLDPECADDALRGVSSVVHLAARVVSRPLKDEAEVRAMWRLNHEASVQLAEAARRSGAGRFLFASTCGCYDHAPRDRPADEDAAIAPAGPYAASKARAEGEIIALRSATFHPTVLRYATIFGAAPRLNLEPLINGLVHDAMTHGRLQIFGPKAWRPYLHVADAARATRLALEATDARTSGLIFNVGADGLHATKEQIARMIQERLPAIEVVLDATRGDPRDYCVSFGRFHDATGFVARHGLEDGIDDLIRHMAAPQAAPPT